MPKIIVTEFISLDGVFEAPGDDGSDYKYKGWTAPYGDEDFQKFKSAELEEADSLLLGRITYEAFATSWPKHTGDPFSDKFNSMPHYVVSHGQPELTWENSHLITGDIEAEIKKLEGTIYVHGSGQIVRLLMEHNLVDQFNLLVFPVVLGEGKKLFEGATKADLKLVESAQFSSGVVKLIYQPKDN